MFYSVTYAESKLWLDPWSLHIMVNTHTRTRIHKWSSCGWTFIEEYYEGGSLDRSERIGNRNEGLFAFKKIASKSHQYMWSISTNGLVQHYLILYFYRTARAFRFKRFHRGIIKRFDNKIDNNDEIYVVDASMQSAAFTGG